MATTSELPSLDSTMSTLKEKRNYLIGAASVVLLVIAVVVFARTQAAESRYRPWRAALADGFPWEATSAEIAARAAEVAGTDAEPLLRYWEALQLHTEKDDPAALQKLQEFAQAFPDHYLMSRPMVVPSHPSASMVPPAERIGAEIVKLADWGRRYPTPTSNPAPSSETVTLQTARGPITLSLYLAESPESCASFAQLAASLKESYVVNAIEDSWVELGVQATGDPIDVTTGMDKFPPLELNNLYHFKGSVAFAQGALSAAPHNPSLKIWLDDDFMEDGNTTVFATVTAGLDILEQLARETKAEDEFTRLAEPLQITDVQMQTSLSTEAPVAEDVDTNEDSGDE